MSAASEVTAGESVASEVTSGEFVTSEVSQGEFVESEVTAGESVRSKVTAGESTEIAGKCSAERVVERNRVDMETEKNWNDHALLIYLYII